jgi:plasmid maintenance system antidote protein VapI
MEENSPHTEKTLLKSNYKKYNLREKLGEMARTLNQVGKNEADDSQGNLIQLKKAFERVQEVFDQIKEKYELAKQLEAENQEEDKFMNRIRT